MFAMSESYTIEDVLATPIVEAIDPEIVKDIVNRPPFVHIPGTFNARDIGSDEQDGARSGYIVRSGTFEDADDATLASLQKLNITTIYDLRNLRETQDRPDPQFSGIEIQWCPSTVDNDLEKNFQARVAQKLNIHEEYAKLMRSHAPKFEAVFRHILELPDKPLLFHCFAGKDRTGILAALISLLAQGEDRDGALSAAQRDYDLSRVGIEPVRELLLAKVLSYGNVDPKDAGGFADLRAFVVELSREYGGVHAYLNNHLGFTSEEIQQIRENLRPRPSGH
ncbi:hypothetical protein CBER1_07266 [Cercospora berteroae]|uniref:Tyrosine specific protein phosphatases domain-containing protein n=1 Tax=Cercospora berteroae TaxID=357750 RepID=A0A2S6BTQ6_9PEZI|nr:hypothetical protein CBER1_07266 [Cercospora berteroae]